MSEYPAIIHALRMIDIKTRKSGVSAALTALETELLDVLNKAQAFDEIADGLAGYKEWVYEEDGSHLIIDCITFGNFASEIILNLESEES